MTPLRHGPSPAAPRSPTPATGYGFEQIVRHAVGGAFRAWYGRTERLSPSPRAA
jgi:hypothetical protein